MLFPAGGEDLANLPADTEARMRILIEIGYRLRRKGLAGLDEIEQEFEKTCGFRFGAGHEVSNFYRMLARSASQHEDCDRAKRWYLKGFAHGSDGPRSFEPSVSRSHS